MKKRRLNSIDLLPRSADSIREQAVADFVEKRCSQVDILARMNAELVKLNLPQVSKSTLNRWLLDGESEGFSRRYFGAQEHFGKPNCCPLCGSEVKPVLPKAEWINRMRSLLRGARA